MLFRSHEISKHVQTFDAFLTILESKYQEPKHDVVVSLAEVQAAVTEHMSLYQHIESLIVDDDKLAPYRWLEAFYSSTTIAQMSGNEELYKTIGGLFFSCLAVYLRPLRRWMEDGELSSGFFIKASTEEDAKLSQWERYNVEVDEEGEPANTPAFLHVAVNKILTSGKSLVVLKKLGRYDAMRATWSSAEPPLTFESVCGGKMSGLLPFPELFDEAFDTWVKAKHHTTSSMLRKCLFEECGLSTSLDALEWIYFLSDGATSTLLAHSIFARLVKGKHGWNDSFTLTELCRETIGQLPEMQPENLRVTTTRFAADVDKARRTVRSLASISISYRLPWAVGLIIRPATLTTYRRIFTLLLQLRRASSILTASRLLETSEPQIYYLIRTKLLWFVQTIYHYLTSNVLVPNIVIMRQEMGEADDVDKMLGSHNDFIKRLHDQMLLGKRLELIHKTILQVLDLAIGLEDAREVALDHSHIPLEKGKEDMDSEFESSSDEEEEDEEDKELDDELMSDVPTPPRRSYRETLGYLNNEYERMVEFVTAGLRGVARTGKEEMWDVLAEKLESGRR